MIRKLS